MSDLLSRINPLYKFVFIIATSLALAFTRSLALNIWVFALCMLALIIGARPKQILRALILLIPVSFFAFSVFMTGYRFGTTIDTGEFGTSIISQAVSGTIMATRVYAFAGLGLIFSLTTEPYELLKSMKKSAKLPRKFAYGMLCAINLLPLLRVEYKNAKLALQVRGVKSGIFGLKPIFSMLANCFRWSEVLSIAMFSKGFHEE